MKNFFLGDTFHLDLDSLIDSLEYDDDLLNLPDDWSCELQTTNAEKPFVLTKEFVISAILEQLDKFENRLPDSESDLNEIVTQEIENAIYQSVDIDVLNKLIPYLYYPTGKYFTITKSDLLKYYNPI